MYLDLIYIHKQENYFRFNMADQIVFLVDFMAVNCDSDAVFKTLQFSPVLLEIHRLI